MEEFASMNCADTLILYVYYVRSVKVQIAKWPPSSLLLLGRFIFHADTKELAV